MRTLSRAGFSLILATLAACGGGDSSEKIADAEPPGADAAETCDPVEGEPELAFEEIARGFDKPVAVVASPIDHRLFVLEQHTGMARVVTGDGRVLGEPFFEIAGEVARGMEQGLLSLAFHPSYASNGRLFITYTRNGDDAIVLEEWRVSQQPDKADKDSRRELLVVAQATNFHNGGRIAFGLDGYLYMGLGDGGPQFDPDGNTQNMADLRGKFIRIDIDKSDGATAYSIPADNPFVATPGARPEIWVLGVRNPWGWSFDSLTGDLYFGDVGLARWEEIDIIAAADGAGANYGWPIVMGDECMEEGCDPAPYEPPLYSYSYINQVRCATVGGVVYRGCKMPGHHGRFFFSDFCASFVRSFRHTEADGGSTSEVTEHESVTDVLQIVSAMGRDADGEMLMLDWEDGLLYRLVPAP